ncbi:filamentous hemagglutinin N-terminal domain-containing protein [Pantoea alhagi]|uniref:filamentous hemagglutinin N-terminal domain-containing protein n=1 Tax=Pantoea alhagi TaxID=1891675 RepID=UPI00202ADECC|nr:filamentous hemagglutinin N-terminal domain-containing protein [Pantoea alhagi]URQ62117.1 filamentous hemagglutinin N-terminal domain-containing protein [Pantoea alhagi]
MRNRTTGRAYVKYHPVAACILLCLASMTQAANNRNMTASFVNGVPVIDINKANDRGISHNVYDKFNVDKKGLILNNSQNAINTMLAGEIKGNSKLSSGAAKVILNEVTSKNHSALQGWLEVAGNKAHVIVANPNGISCQGCGFINAEKVTVTTGKPDIQNGMLKGYQVNGGSVTLSHLESASPTEILARSIAVNDKLYAEELSMVAGNNYVDINGKITGTVKAQGSRQGYGIDVATIGGMYANKISLISSEKGVGVGNSGIIAGTDNIQIDSSGKLVNNYGQIKSAGLVSIKAQQGLENITGKINSESAIHIDTNQSIINNNQAGHIAARKDIYIDSGTFNNINGKISAGGTLGVNTHNKILTNTGKGDSVGIHAGAVALQTGMLDNINGLIKGGYVGVGANRVDNTYGTIEATGDMDISSNGNIENRQGLLRSTVGHVHLDAVRGSINNGSTRTADTFSQDSQGIIAGEGGIQIKADVLNSRTGQIASKGNIAITTTSAVDNFQGKLNSSKELYIKAASLLNGQAGISTSGNIHIDLSEDFYNSIGIISAGEGNIELQARRVNNKGGLFVGQDININAKTSVDNSAALMVANKNMTITAADMLDNSKAQDFGDFYGIYLAMPNQKGGLIGRESITINTGRVNNDSGRIVAEFGQLAIKARDHINNTYGHIMADSGLSLLKTQAIYNDYATINSGGSLTIDSGFLSNYSSGSIADNNATGIISADKDLQVNLGSTFTNYGWISGKQNASITVQGIFSNRNAVSAGQDLKITAKSRLYNYKDIAAGNQLILKSDSDVKNGWGSNIQGASTTTIDIKGDLYNEGNIVSNDQLTIRTGRNLYNYNNILTNGQATISVKNISNSGVNAYLGGVAGLELKAGVISNSGNFFGL